jgi:hypothetical protein
MIRRHLLFGMAIFWVLTVTHVVSAAETNNVLSQIERMASAGKQAEPSLGESIADGIRKNPAEISAALLPRLKDKNLTEMQMAIYVWALGLAKDEKAVSPIKEVYQQSGFDLVKRNCLRALATIGGQQAGNFLLSILDATTDRDKRFDILNLMAQMQCETALTKTEEVLKEDAKEFYWQPIFVFGKMGDKAVPFLLKRINDKDRNVRANTINVLGQWLIPPEVAKPLQDQFWIEQDKEIRSMILSSLERTITDLSQMKAVFEQVAAKEKDGELQKYARETLANVDQMKTNAVTFARKKQVSAASFKREYAKLFESAGKKGSYEDLAVYSTIQDEAQLKTLRERILQRDSDEAFYDYQKVNGIIMQNRFMEKLGGQKAGRP